MRQRLNCLQRIFRFVRRRDPDCTTIRPSKGVAGAQHLQVLRGQDENAARGLGTGRSGTVHHSRLQLQIRHVEHVAPRWLGNPLAVAR